MNLNDESFQQFQTFYILFGCRTDYNPHWKCDVYLAISLQNQFDSENRQDCELLLKFVQTGMSLPVECGC